MKDFIYNHKISIFLFFLILAGFLCRYIGLTTNSLWADEMFVCLWAKQGFYALWQMTLQGEFNPPVFFWCEHVVYLITGYFDEFTLRILPAVFGTLTIPVFYWLGKEIYDEEGGLVFATLIAFFPIHVYFSQEARGYTLALLFTSLMLLFALRSLRLKDRKNYTLFALFAILSFWTHFYTMIFILMVFLYVLIDGKKELVKKWLYACGVFMFGIAPLVVETVRLYMIRTSLPITYGYQGMDTLFQNFIFFIGINPISVVLYTYLLLFGVLYGIRQDRKKGLLCGGMIIGSFAVAYVTSFMFPYMPKYIIYLIPAFFVFFTASWYSLKKSLPWKYGLHLFLAVLIIINCVLLGLYYTQPSKDNWKDTMDQFGNITQYNDEVVIAPIFMHHLFEYYYTDEKQMKVVSSKMTLEDLSHEWERYDGGNSTSSQYFILQGYEYISNTTIQQWALEHNELVIQSENIFIFKHPQSLYQSRIL